MRPRLDELVRERVLAEGPDLATGDYDRYVNEIINSWSNAELLERISDAMEKIK